jgi:hypothetical protein
MSLPSKLYLRYLAVVLLILTTATGYADSNWRCAGAQSIEVELASTAISVKRAVTSHTLERSFVFFRTCPVRAYAVLDRDSNVFASWLESLDTYARRKQNWAVLQQFKRVVLTQRRQPNQRLAAIILRHLDGVTAPQTPGNELVRPALLATIEDWSAADGEFRRWLSDDFLFLLSIDSTLFYRAMSTNRVLFNEWLSYMPDLSFAGLSENRGISDQFRARLLFELRSRGTDTKLESTRRTIVSRLRGVKYRVVE